MSQVSPEERLKAQVRHLQQQNLELTQELEQLYASRSWRITAPLRVLAAQTRSASQNRAQAQPSRILLFGVGLTRVRWLRRWVEVILRPFPGLKKNIAYTLARAKQKHFFMSPGFDHQEDMQDLQVAMKSDVRLTEEKLRDHLFVRSHLQEKVRALCLTGHVNGSYSLASVNRHLLQRLHQDWSDLELTLRPWEGIRQSRVEQAPGGQQELEQLNAWCEQGYPDAPYQVQVFHHYPLLEQVDPALGLPVALFFWEESKVPASMIATLNQHYAGVVVTAWFVKKALMDAGCCLPIQVVTLPLVHPEGAAQTEINDLRRVAQRQSVQLLHVSSCFPRKGADVLLQAFDTLAAKRPEVELRIKTFANPHNEIEQWIQTWVAPEHRDRLHLIMEDYSAEQMAVLYQQADVVVLPTRGEGLNMPALEAGAFSRPLVVTGYGAHTDFASHENAWWIGYRFAQAQTHLSEMNSVWCDPSVDHLVTRLDDLVTRLLNEDQEALNHAQHLHNLVQRRIYSSEASDAFLSGLQRLALYAEQTAATPRPAATLTPSICMLTTWGEPCGIAEYSRFLARELQGLGAQMHLSLPQGRRVEAEAGDTAFQITEDWLHGQSPDLEWLETTSEIIWLQHHIAFYKLDSRLQQGVVQRRRQGQRVYITLHSTRPLLDMQQGQMETAAKCLNAFDRVFVHTLDDLNALKKIGVTDHVTWMLQGVEVPQLEPRLSDRPLIGSFGFLWPHKGISLLIEAFAQAKKQGWIPQEAGLRLLTTVRDDALSPKELEVCQNLIEQHQLTADVEWQTRFLPLDQVHQLLSECQLMVLPYQFTQESSSAAVRTAVAACAHVATTPARIFDEVRDVTLPIQGYAVQDIMLAMKEYFAAEAAPARQAMEVRRQAWIEQRRWQSVAQHYMRLFKAAMIDRDFQKPFI